MIKRALLIGVNDYSSNGTLRNLHFASQDAQAVAQALKTCYGFTDEEITLMTCSKQGSLCPAVPYAITCQLSPERFPKQMDLFIFGFWGHGGIWKDDQRYLCVNTSRLDQLPQTSIPLQNVLDSINALPAKNTCVILDCCQNRLTARTAGEFVPAERRAEYLAKLQAEQQAEQQYFQQAVENMARSIVINPAAVYGSNPVSQRSAAILNSCGKDEMAFEWDERQHGIFTAHLLDAMNQRLGSVSDWVAYLGDRVTRTAMELGKETQTPSFHLNGSIPLPRVGLKKNPQISSQSTSSSTSKPSQPVVPAGWVISDLLLLLIVMFQETIQIYDNDAIINFFVDRKKHLLALRDRHSRRELNNSAAYEQILLFAKQTSSWIRANRELFRGRQMVFVSYTWYTWLEFTERHNLEHIADALRID